MKRRRSLFLALVCTLVVTNVAVVFGMQSVDKSSTDYPGNIKGYVSAMVVESGWFTHRGRSYVMFTGSDAECLSKAYAATSSIGSLASLGRKNR